MQNCSHGRAKLAAGQDTVFLWSVTGERSGCGNQRGNVPIRVIKDSIARNINDGLGACRTWAIVASESLFAEDFSIV